jgi:hypothetical protein
LKLYGLDMLDPFRIRLKPGLARLHAGQRLRSIPRESEFGGVGIIPTAQIKDRYGPTFAYRWMIWFPVVV